MDKKGFKSKDKASQELLVLPVDEIKKIAPQLTPEEARKIEKLIISRIEVSQTHSGPIPHPVILAGYGKINKHFPNRVIEMAEKEQNSRHVFTEKFLNNDKLYTVLGIVFGFIIAMTAMIGGIYLTAIGKNVTGFSAIIGSLAALVAVFIMGKNSGNKDNSESTNDPEKQEYGK